MAIVVYKCDTCKREIEKSRNYSGLEVIGRCVITHGCRGSLYQTKLHPDYVRGSIPDPVTGLDDWKQRKVLHNHTQAIERNEWVIEHNMGVIPSVSVFVARPIQGDPDNKEEITPIDIVALSDNILKLVFDREWAGTAQLVSKQSDPNLLQPTIRTVVEEETAFQISNLGEISIATRINSAEPTQDLSEPIISLLVGYSSTVGGVLEELYSADDQPSLLSAWQGSAYDRIVVNVNSARKPFVVRSYNGITPNMTAGNIDSGSTFKFVGVDPVGDGNNFRPIEKGEVLILLATSPYDIVDKVLDQYIDVYDVSDENNPFGFFYNNGEFFATTDIITSVYPPILNIDN